MKEWPDNRYKEVPTQALAKLVAPHYSAGTKDVMIKRLETFLLRQSLQSNMITALAMKMEFQLNQPSQTLECSRLGQEELPHLSTRFWQCRKQTPAEAGDTCRE
jgi:hypothetical protein